MSPCPGKFSVVTFTVSVEGATPVLGVTVSHLPPSAVLVVAVQFRVPDPPFWICTVWDGGLLWLGWKEKLTWPGRLSKNGVLLAATVRVTGTVIAKSWLEYWVRVISPV